MEYTRMEMNILSASDLNSVNRFSKMRVYAVVSASGDPYQSQVEKTPVDRDGGTNPRWDFPIKFTVNETLARWGQLTLEVKLRTERNFRGDKDVGEVHVPVKQLLDQPGDGRSFQSVSYRVRKPSGGHEGTLNLSYKFEEKIPQPSTAPSMPTAENEAPGAGSSEGEYARPDSPPTTSGHPHQRRMRMGEVLQGVQTTMLVGNMASNMASEFDAATDDVGHDEGFDGGSDF